MREGSVRIVRGVLGWGGRGGEWWGGRGVLGW